MCMRLPPVERGLRDGLKLLTMSDYYSSLIVIGCILFELWSCLVFLLLGQVASYSELNSYVFYSCYLC
jgi:hypothetical protein